MNLILLAEGFHRFTEPSTTGEQPYEFPSRQMPIKGNARQAPHYGETKPIKGLKRPTGRNPFCTLFSGHLRHRWVNPYRTRSTGPLFHDDLRADALLEQANV